MHNEKHRGKTNYRFDFNEIFKRPRKYRWIIIMNSVSWSSCWDGDRGKKGTNKNKRLNFRKWIRKSKLGENSGIYEHKMLSLGSFRFIEIEEDLSKIGFDLGREVTWRRKRFTWINRNIALFYDRSSRVLFSSCPGFVDHVYFRFFNRWNELKVFITYLIKDDLWFVKISTLQSWQVVKYINSIESHRCSYLVLIPK